jgi:hypothetical protein
LFIHVSCHNWRSRLFWNWFKSFIEGISVNYDPSCKKNLLTRFVDGFRQAMILNEILYGLSGISTTKIARKIILYSFLKSSNYLNRFLIFIQVSINWFVSKKLIRKWTKWTESSRRKRIFVRVVKENKKTDYDQSYRKRIFLGTE